jgi:hypothetical protein
MGRLAPQNFWEPQHLDFEEEGKCEEGDLNPKKGLK